jgi:guanylate kinase
MSNKKGHLFVVSGPSGTGKSTLIKRFLDEDGHSCFSVSYTTRKRRDHEAEGRDYYFVDSERFQQMIDQGGFLEWEPVHGYFYGTPRKEVSEPLSRGVDVILDIDVKGALKVREQWPEAVLIFIDTPSMDELIKRLSARGEKEIEKRMERVKEEISQKGLFTYVVINDTLDSSYEQFKSVIRSVRGQQNGENNRRRLHG